MSEQNMKTLGQIAYEAMREKTLRFCQITPEDDLGQWSELTEEDREVLEAGAAAVRKTVLAEFEVPQSAFTPALAEKIESQMHRDASLSLPPQAAQVVQERRRMAPEERAAVGEFVIKQPSTPQRNK